jgi:hypothetical protein
MPNKFVSPISTKPWSDTEMQRNDGNKRAAWTSHPNEPSDYHNRKRPFAGSFVLLGGEK